MDTIRVLIDNWPETNHIAEYFTIAIALIALGGSLYSVYLTRKSFIAAHRPYVWAVSYVYGRTMEPIPSLVMLRIADAPARIWHEHVRISLSTQVLAEWEQEDMVRFPDNAQASEWSFGFDKDEFDKIMKRPLEELSQLRRQVFFEYSSLNGGERYHYILEQEFVPSDRQWRSISEEST